MESDRLAELFGEGLALEDAAAREAFLEGIEEPFASELRSLLAAHVASGDFLETPALVEAAALVPDLLGSAVVGTTIGAWRIDALLQTGGMGSVFEAHRTGEDFTQRAALKLVRVGFESPELLARFTRERQLLAQVEHPHIARLLDGGATADGLPWLAMDYVDGMPIDLYADHHRLGLEARLDLFDQVADAIAYLHQNLITHRDIKASNVLVDRQGRVKVLDFGIASLLNDAASNAEAAAERRLSFASAAPEQVRGAAISTATDVYALGMLLYRLLAGVPPYEIHAGLTAAELEQVICVRAPPLASLAAASAADAVEIAARRATSPRRLHKALRGDLDTILATTLHKDPSRRYRAVADLRADILRHRGHRPILAHPNTAAYRTGKFLRRHWKGLGATAAVIAALALGLAVALWQAEEARHQRDRAQAMNTFMQDVLAEADPYAADADKTVRETLAEASQRLDASFADQPLLEASLRQVIGGVQATLLDLAAAEANLRRALDLLDSRVAADDELRLRAELNLAWIEASREHWDAAEARYLSVIERLHDGLPAPFRALAHNDLGVVYVYTERYEDAITQQEMAMRISPESPDRVATLVNLGYAYDGLGQLDRAKDYFLQAIERLRALGEAGQTMDLAHALNNYGNVLSQEDRDSEALPYYLESLAVRQRAAGPESDSAATQHLNIGRLLLDMQRPDEALPHLERAVDILPRYRDETSLYTRVARASHARAVLLTGAGDPAPARATLATVLASLRADTDASAARFVEQVDGWLREADAARAPMPSGR